MVGEKISCDNFGRTPILKSTPPLEVAQAYARFENCILGVKKVVPVLRPFLGVQSLENTGRVKFINHIVLSLCCNFS